MGKWTGYLVAAIWAVVLLGGAFRPSVAAATGSAPRPQVNYVAPPFTLTDLAGQAVNLADLRGKAVFLNFWASWCGPCRLEMPEVARLAADPPPGAMVLTVNATATEPGVEAVRAFLVGRGYRFPVALDPDGRTVDAYKVVSYPTSLFIDPHGVVTARVSGPLTRPAMLGYLRDAARR